MPALSYKERFVPLVKAGTKKQTIRAFRKNPFKPGQTLMHYYGMRTKVCAKIRENTVCTEVQTIFILTDGDVITGPAMGKAQAEMMLETFERINPTSSSADGYNFLSPAERDALAYADGFRFESSTPANPVGCFALMLRWWNQTHTLPFTGQLIKW